MSYLDRVVDFIQREKGAHSDLADRYEEFGTLFHKRLWHQLSEEVVAFVEDEANSRGKNFAELHDEFVVHFSSKMNKLSYVRVVVAAARQMHGGATSGEGLGRALGYLTKWTGAGVATTTYGGKWDEGDEEEEQNQGMQEEEEEGAAGDGAASEAKEEAPKPQVVRDAERNRTLLGEGPFLVAHMEVAVLECRRGRERLGGAMVEEGKEILDGLDGAHPRVHAAFYAGRAEFFRIRGPMTDFYRSSLQYLAYTPLESLSADQRLALAREISMAALAAEDVYNFGEVLATPILSALEGTEDGWLGDLMRAFNAGDVDSFNALLADHRAAVAQHSAMAAGLPTMKQKIALLCLVELVFRRSAADRTITFAEVADATRMPVAEVEWLLMRAMAVDLIRGSIDQVEGVVRVSYVQPRVLDDGQTTTLRDQLATWRKTVHSMQVMVEDGTRELFS